MVEAGNGAQVSFVTICEFPSHDSESSGYKSPVEEEKTCWILNDDPIGTLSSAATELSLNVMRSGDLRSFKTMESRRIMLEHLISEQPQW